MIDITFYAVGGSVRDELLGLRVKDHDFTVVVDGTDDIEEAWNLLLSHLDDNGYETFLAQREYLTARARFPRGHPYSHLTADFVLAREEGRYFDGRRPEWVKPGTLEQDLARRDFTVNSLAKDERGEIIDLFDGMTDLHYRQLRFVGDPMDRLREDGLRILRAIRFKITKDFIFHGSIWDAMENPEVPTLLGGVSVERRREELERCFQHDTLGTLDLLVRHLPPALLDAIFIGNLRLAATQKKDLVRRQT